MAVLVTSMRRNRQGNQRYLLSPKYRFRAGVRTQKNGASSAAFTRTNYGPLGGRLDLSNADSNPSRSYLFDLSHFRSFFQYALLFQ